eukprot:comp11870_c0_seq1/m.6507 comp11870_c0_seq1/g.6507  ORF comp11870_c0_seq1/g.6507 comp11870_c0_seq1/m.6507 type:complete len:439 (-) comp11870_c0_seq1:86-1402(-)
MSAWLVAHPHNANTVALVDGDKFRVFDLAAQTYVQPEFSHPPVEQPKEQAGQQKKKGKDKKQKEEEGAEEAEERDEQEGDGHASRVLLCAVFDPTGRHFATVDACKTLCLWDADSWTCIATRTVARRASRIVFSADGQSLFVADKAGDVYMYCVQDMGREEVVVLGILSMLLDVIVTHDGKYIITSDRDDKVRVSRYPNSYSIQAFCLGHANMVTSVCLPTHQPDMLVSGSGDGTVRVWRYLDGTCLCTHTYTDENTKEAIVSGITYSTKDHNLTVCIEGQSTVHVHQLGLDGTLSTVQAFDLGCAVACTAFGPSGRLWVSGEDGVVAAYDWVDGKYVAVPAATEYINSNASFGEIKGNTRPFHNLQKRPLDCTHEYHERKEKRIEAKKARQAHAALANTAESASDQSEQGVKRQSDHSKQDNKRVKIADEPTDMQVD